MYAHGHKRSNRAVARATTFEASQHSGTVPPGDRFEFVQALYSDGTPVTWKNKQAFLGSVRLMKRSGELTDEGQVLETQGWVPPGRVGTRIPA